MSNPNANYFKEKLVLNEEEKSLKEMLTKFQDQLNRLKIEELALLSHIKMQEEEKKKSAVAAISRHTAGEQQLAKDQHTHSGRTSVAGSEGGSSISSAAPVGFMHQKRTSYTNREELDLAVTKGLGLNQEMEEEEEEEEEEEHGGKDDDDPLYSFMDTV